MGRRGSAIRLVLEGEALVVHADIFKEGHDVLVAVVRWRQSAPKAMATEWAEVPMKSKGNDLWEATLPLVSNGRYEFTVEAWPDFFATWVTELKRKVDAGRDVKSELLEGAARRLAGVVAEPVGWVVQIPYEEDRARNRRRAHGPSGRRRRIAGRELADGHGQYRRVAGRQRADRDGASPRHSPPRGAGVG